jgi:hypothetical protein
VVDLLVGGGKFSELVTPWDGAVFDAFAASLRGHIKYVQEAGRKLGVPDERLLAHDNSKWSAAEFPAYAWKFHGDKKIYDQVQVNNAFSKAWLHHIHHNDHHWQHWIFPDGYTPSASSVENGVIEMSTYAALEMIADWMGASRVYTGSWDMADWLTENISRVTLHSNTTRYVREVLSMLGYSDIVNMQRFAHELKS